MYPRLIKHMFIGYLGEKCYLFLVMSFLQVPAIPGSYYVRLASLPALHVVSDHTSGKNPGPDH